jgi:hypothetical protein
MHEIDDKRSTLRHRRQSGEGFFVRQDKRKKDYTVMEVVYSGNTLLDTP